MEKKMTKREALKLFRESFPNHYFISKVSGRLDKVARSEAWNNFTDALCKDGEITAKQYDSWTNPF